MSESGSLPQSPPLASALERLARARVRELWVRAALSVWCTLVLMWVLPLGPWSATALPPLVAVAVGAALAAGGGALALLQRAVSDTDAIREALDQARRLTERPPENDPGMQA